MSQIVVSKKSLKHQIAFVNSPEPFPAIIAGLGAGKTDAGVSRILKQKYRYPTLDQAYYMPDYNLIRDRAIPAVEEELSKIGQPYRLNKTDKIITLENKGKIYFRSMDKPESIIAYEVADSIVDEIDTLKPDKAKHVYRKIRERNRQKKPDGLINTIGLITTPDNGTSGFVWDTYNRCIDKDTMTDADYELLNGGIVDGYHLIEASTEDNPFLPPEYLDGILDLYDPILAALYTKGKMVNLTFDKVYHYYNKIRHQSHRTIQRGDKLNIGIDFNVGGCANVVYVREGKTLHAVSEFAPRDTDAIVIYINEHFQGHIIELFPDSSGNNESSNASRSDIQILRDGIRTPNPPIINAPQANGPVRDRINAMNAKLSKDELLVNSTTCPRYSNALAAQGYDKNGKPEKHEDHKGGSIDDYNDAGGYPVVRMFPVDRSAAKVIPKR